MRKTLLASRQPTSVQRRFKRKKNIIYVKRTDRARATLLKICLALLATFFFKKKKRLSVKKKTVAGVKNSGINSKLILLFQHCS